MKVFLTGATGIVGGSLLTHLLGRGDEVVALVRTEAGETRLRERGVQTVRGDLFDEPSLAAGMRGCDVLYHVAGVNTMCPQDPMELLHANVRGAESAVRAAAVAEVGRVVLTSSAAALGEAHGTIGSESSPHRGYYLSDYERSKREGEVAAFAAARATGVDLVAVNPSSVQGPGRASGTGRILIGYLNGRLRAFIDTRISLVDIDDCSRGHIAAAERGAPGERYVLNSGSITAGEALELVSEISGVRHPVRILPRPVATVAAAAIEAGCRVARKKPPVCRQMMRTMLHGHHYDGSRAVRELGLEYTPVRQTLERTVAWARAEGLVPAA